MPVLSAPQALGELSDLKTPHLVLQGAQRNSKISRCGRHVPVGAVEGAENEVAFERITHGLQQVFFVLAAGADARQLVLER